MMDSRSKLEMNFCRRCGSKLQQQDKGGHVFMCEKGHIIFANADPAVGVVLYNDQEEILMLVRAIDPGKGQYDIPGGFCDGAEPLEEACAREIEEETGITRDKYGKLEFLETAIDPYAYKGEVLQVLSTIFKARLKGDVVPRPADDAASTLFIKLRDIDIDKVYFPSIKQALTHMREELDA